MKAAALIDTALGRLLPGPLLFRLKAWDGSATGPEGAPVVVLRHPRAVRRLLWQPGEIGLAEAYAFGELDVEGDLKSALTQVRRAMAGRRPAVPGPRAWPGLLATAGRLGALGVPPARSAGRAVVGGALHSRARDRAVISHHYDLSNDFYALLLGPAMAYSCAYYTRGQQDLQSAQETKFDLICRKLALEPGSRLLDVGCGWGALARHAARRFGARVTAVTLSEHQHRWATDSIAQAGVADLVDVQLRDYRDIESAAYDAISCVEMGEHVGKDQYPAFAARLRTLLRSGGRLLVQQMSRGSTAPGGGAFIETYIAPDMHMRPVGQTVDLIEDAGLEVVHAEAMREHYARTIDAWHDTLRDRRAEFVSSVGRPTVRLWELYLAGSSLAFAEGRMGVDQILARRPGGQPSTVRPADWYQDLP
ncbi:cyclopropane-fatty-acyl-phospholipid synthase family protein [Streptomyces sp. FH025]|uniref:SAM-dependent methyltransferase n=1 Tax=Streptomyces sp. FH025 TaxID=2815937 RepID=UPI001A9D47AE|nr:cyclopropane-fatty-acyl-phospholipid synthase family protein [Streptomyces sp. FH025]MBO1415808.1 class I SAM-dependent methyltransferase [Streptomyces sp. FH025]